MLATCRSGQRPALDVSPDRIREIELGPLSHQDVASLIADRTGRQIPMEVAADIAGRAQGNPLIVEETVRHLAEQWSTSSEQLPEDFTSDVRSAFERRILTLPDELRQLLEVASVLGDEFDEEVLAALCQRTALLHHGEELELVNRLEPGRWKFAHVTCANPSTSD